MTVKEGQSSLFIDSSEDKFGYQKVYSFKCETLQIGEYFFDKNEKKMVFQEAEQIKDNVKLYLRCVVGEKELVF